MVAPNPHGYELLLEAWDEYKDSEWADILDDWLTWFESVLGDDEPAPVAKRIDAALAHCERGNHM